MRCADHAARDEIFAHGLRAAGAERDVVFARTALVGMALDGEGVAVVLIEPLRLLVERRPRLLRQFRRIGLEEHAVADIDDEILLAAGRGGAGHGRGLIGCCLAQPAIASAPRMKAANLAPRMMLTTFIPVPPLFRRRRTWLVPGAI